MVKEHGAQYGLGNYANAITKGTDGRYHTASAADRRAILALRNDAQTSAYMAGEFSQQQRARLQSGLGRDVCGGELYAAHFLGSDAACRLIQLSENNPTASAAKAFPAAASANRSVFYHSDGSAKTVREVYNWALKNHGDSPVAFTRGTEEAGASERATTGVYAGNASADARLANAEFEMLAPSWMNAPANDGEADPSIPRSTFLMTPGVIDLLTQMSPVADRRAAS
jgi:hypothetical protein